MTTALSIIGGIFTNPALADTSSPTTSNTNFSQNFGMKDISTSEDTSNIIIGNLNTNTINGVNGTDTSNPNSKLSDATNNLIVGNNNKLTGNSTVVVGLSNTVTGESYGGGNGNLQVYGLSNTVKGASSQVFGQENKVYGVYHTVSGYDNNVGKDSNKIDDHTYNVVSGYKNKVEGSHNVVLGETNEAKKADNTAVNYTVALGYSAKTLGNDAVAIGKQAEANIGSTAIGKEANATGNYSTALGKESKALGSYTVAIGNGAKAEHSDSVALGSNAQTTRSDEVSVGKSGSEKFIANVKDAVNDTDAVNKRQMEKADAKTLADANQYTDLKLGTLQTQVHNFQSDFNELNGKLGKLDRKLERGLAAANALSGLVLPQVVGKASFSAAVGGYGSSNAVAIGVGYTPKANITLKSGIAVNAGKNSKISYQMGAGWVW
ncbi:adhesin [Haemophilus influenzae biotype aegyptius]|nr:adhesin [Haemophilus influenzae biotype aegyptius]